MYVCIYEVRVLVQLTLTKILKIVATDGVF